LTDKHFYILAFHKVWNCTL